VRFAPVAAGMQTCSVNTGSACPAVGASGTGQLPPACTIFPDSLDFGLVNLGTVASRTFNITNRGGGTLAGHVVSPCPRFTVNGTGLYSLGAGQTAQFTVNFSPTATGAQACTLQTGSSGCGGVALKGSGHRPPETAFVSVSVDGAGHASWTSNFLTVAPAFTFVNVTLADNGCGMGFHFTPGGTGKAELRVAESGLSGININPSCTDVQVSVDTTSQEKQNGATFLAEVGTCTNDLGFVPNSFCGNVHVQASNTCLNTTGETKCGIQYTDFSATNSLTARTITFTYDGWVLVFPKGRPPFGGPLDLPRGPARPGIAGKPIRSIRR
jgi:hypothetical protein